MNCWKIICWEFSTSIKQLCKENPRYRRRSNIQKKKQNPTVDSFPAMKRDMSPWIISMYQYWAKGFPGGSAGKESACNAGNLGSISGLGTSPGEGKRIPTPVFWPGEFHGLYSSWGHKELDTTEWLSLQYWAKQRK